MDILRDTKMGTQYAINRRHALLHMMTWKFIIQTHTKAAIERIPPTRINTRNIYYGNK